MDADVLVPIALFLSIVAIVKIVSDSRTRRRLIDRGVSAEEARALLSSPGGASRASSSLRWGLVAAGIGAALVVVQLASFDGGEPIVPGLILLFAGGALLAHSVMEPWWTPGRWRGGNAWNGGNVGSGGNAPVS